MPDFDAYRNAVRTRAMTQRLLQCSSAGVPIVNGWSGHGQMDRGYPRQYVDTTISGNLINRVRLRLQVRYNEAFEAYQRFDRDLGRQIGFVLWMNGPAGIRGVWTGNWRTPTITTAPWIWSVDEVAAIGRRKYQEIELVR